MAPEAPPDSASDSPGTAGRPSVPRGAGGGWARRFWSSAYRAGDHRRCWEDSPEAAGERIAALPPGAGPGLVLDLGCGAGLEMVALARRGSPAAGIDIALAGLAAARARGRRAGLALRLACGDVTALALASGSVGLALDRGCFHQLGRRARRLCGREIARVLAPGGRLVLWGARRSAEEEGVVGLLPGVLAAAFPEALFRLEASEPVTLAAPAGDLPGRRVVLRRR